MKFLIDTNIFIPLEPTRSSEVEGGTTEATKFVQLTAIADRNRWREDDKEQNTVWDIKKS